MAGVKPTNERGWGSGGRQGNYVGCRQQPPPCKLELNCSRHNGVQATVNHRKGQSSMLEQNPAEGGRQNPSEGEATNQAGRHRQVLGNGMGQV